MTARSWPVAFVVDTQTDRRYLLNMTAAHHTIAADFSLKTRRALSKRGITITGATVIPSTGPLPFASGTRGYCLNNNGEHQIRTYSEVAALA
jgi:hypothetical protein